MTSKGNSDFTRKVRLAQSLRQTNPDSRFLITPHWVLYTHLVRMTDGQNWRLSTNVWFRSARLSVLFTVLRFAPQYKERRHLKSKFPVYLKSVAIAHAYVSQSWPSFLFYSG